MPSSVSGSPRPWSPSPGPRRSVTSHPWPSKGCHRSRRRRRRPTRSGPTPRAPPPSPKGSDCRASSQSRRAGKFVHQTSLGSNKSWTRSNTSFTTFCWHYKIEGCSIQSGSETSYKGFVICFLKVPLTSLVGHRIMAGAVLPNGDKFN